MSRVRLLVENNIYQTPKSNPKEQPPGRRWAHVVVAFFSAMLIPALLAYGVLLLWFPDYFFVVNPEAIGTIVIGAIISAAAVYRHRKMPLWVAALVGVFVVLLLAVAPSVWDTVLGRSAA